MNNVYKGKAKYILAPVVILLLITGALASSAHHLNLHAHFSMCDTLPPAATDKGLQIMLKSILAAGSNVNNDSSHNNLTDTSIITKDTLHIKVSKDSLEKPVVYHADDSVVMDVPAKKIILYGNESKTTYKDNELTAPGIEFDQGNHLVTAALKKDSLGNVIAYPVFKQGTLKTVSDTIAFNMKSGKGMTKGSYTQQGEIYIYGEKIKKISPDVFYAYRTHFTTCNLDTPHFAFVSKKVKFINKKMAITGPVHLEFEGVPIPIYLPFGIFPLVQGRHSGILPPTFTQDAQYGLSLQNFGYYKVLSDNWDITLKGTIYSYGSWTFNPSSTYYKRYHYRGSFLFGYQDMRLNFPGDPDFQQTKSFNLIWNHSMDSKARPGVTFTANVDIASATTNYNQYVVGNPVLNYQNQLSSSITYTKAWQNEPYNITISASHNQNAVTKLFNVTLPNVSFYVNTLYPFRRKEAVGDLKWYENIGIGLNSSLSSTTSFSGDSATIAQTSISKQIANNYQWGAVHSVPISLTLPPLGPLHISPSISYQEKWYQKKLLQTWNAADTVIDSSYQSGFFTARSMSFGVGLTTELYGMFTFGKHSKIQAIRHQITPSISFSYTPDLNSQYYYNLQYDTGKANVRTVSVFDGINGGAFSEVKFAGLNFSVDNNIQMKVLNPKDTGDNAIKKVTILESLNLSGNYNFLLDSFALSVLNLSGGTNLFKNKLGITGSASIDPYELDSNGTRINRLVWKDNLLTLGRLTSANISLNTKFQGGDPKKANANGPVRNLTDMPYDPSSGLTPDEYAAETANITSNPAGYTDFTIPWSVNLGYTLGFSRSERLASISVIEADTTKIPAASISTISQNLTFSGTLGLSAKWQLGLQSSYNITTAQLSYWSLQLSRDMHCWQMTISISNSGYNRSFSITISPKSALLRDLKINRARSFTNEIY